jgi:hypothetical protein
MRVSTRFLFGVVLLLGLNSASTAWATPLLAPTIVSVAPNSGPTTGGTLVTITGTDFQQGATATIGGVACTGVVVASSTSLTCTTGAHAAGFVEAGLVNPDLQGAIGPDAFTYVEVAPSTTPATTSPATTAAATTVPTSAAPVTTASPTTGPASFPVTGSGPANTALVVLAALVMTIGLVMRAFAGRSLRK